MGKNLVRKTFSGLTQSWTAPGGVNRVKVNVYGILENQMSAYAAAGAVTIDGSSRMWGLNNQGQLGNNTTSPVSSPVATVGLMLRQISVGKASQTYGLTVSGQIYAWGDGVGGILGNNTATDSSTPVLVSGGLTWRQVNGGAGGLALAPTGAAYTWGANNAGQLGDNTTDAKSTPVAVLGGLFFSNVTGGSTFNCAIEADTSLGFSWGANTFGTLGDNTTVSKSTPVAISGGLTWKQLSAGLVNAFGLTTDGLAYGWGFNDIGQLGNGNLNNQSTPVAVLGANVFTKISAGDSHVLALAEGGDVYAWGINGQGQLGDGTTTDITSPTLIAGFGSDNIDVIAGAVSSFVVSSDGSILAAGDNGNGLLGDGTTTDRSTPVAVLGFSDGTTYGTDRIQRVQKTLVATRDLDVVPGTAYPIVVFDPTVYFGTTPIYTDGSGALRTEVELEYFA